MRDAFTRSLADLQQRLVDIAVMVESAITDATTAFNEQDVELAEHVVAGDRQVDHLTAELDEHALEVLVRQQPVARDLRIVVTALRISAALERMGDNAEHIAQLARYRFPGKAAPKGLRAVFRELGELDVAIAHALVRLLSSQDLTVADDIHAIDQNIDRLHRQVFDRVLSEGWKGAAPATVDATLASRYHERFADHAVAIAAQVRYLETGDHTGPGS